MPPSNGWHRWATKSCTALTSRWVSQPLNAPIQTTATWYSKPASAQRNTVSHDRISYLRLDELLEILCKGDRLGSYLEGAVMSGRLSQAITGLLVGIFYLFLSVASIWREVGGIYHAFIGHGGGLECDF